MKKLIVFATLLALLLTAFAGCASGKSKKGGASAGPEAAVENYIEVIYSAKTPSKSDLRRIMPDELWEARGGFDSLYEELVEERESEIEDAKEEYGNNYKVTYEILSKEKMDADMLEEGRERFEDDGLNGKKLTQAYIIEVEVTREGSEGEDSVILSLISYQYDGSWYVMPD